MVNVGDYVILNDIIGCVQSISPLTLICQDGKVRELQGEPAVIMTGAQVALRTAEALVRRIRDGNS